MGNISRPLRPKSCKVELKKVAEKLARALSPFEDFFEFLPFLFTMSRKYKDSFVVINEKGLHTRPSTELVKCATAFKAQVTLIYQDYIVSAKSLLGILMLAASRGAKIQVVAEGEDAESAVKAILALARSKFNIKY